MVQPDRSQVSQPEWELVEHGQRLLEIYKPQTEREVMIIIELAKVYQEKEEFERDFKRWMDHEIAQALSVFQRQEADDFLKLSRQWTKAPAAIAGIIGQSLIGAAWLAEFWRMIVARLAPKAIGPAPGMDQATQALLAMGFSDKIQNLSEDGWWWATRFLAIQADHDQAIAAWLRKSGTSDKAAETQQARHKLYDAPDPTTARSELYEEALRQAEHWSNQLNELKKAEPATRQAQLARARCMALPTRGLATSLNNAFKYRDALHKGIKFYETRLANLPKEQAETERYYKRMHKMEERIATFFPPKQAQETTISPPQPADIDQPHSPEPDISEELLAEVVRSGQARPGPAKTLVPHPPEPQPDRRPMSNRKKRLAKMAAREEKARLAGISAGATA